MLVKDLQCADGHKHSHCCRRGDSQLKGWLPDAQSKTQQNPDTTKCYRENFDLVKYRLEQQIKHESA